MVQKSCDHQLRLVCYPIICWVLSQVVSRISSIGSNSSKCTRDTHTHIHAPFRRWLCLDGTPVTTWRQDYEGTRKKKPWNRWYCWWKNLWLTSRGFIPLFTGFHTSQVVVWDFFSPKALQSFTAAIYEWYAITVSSSSSKNSSNNRFAIQKCMLSDWILTTKQTYFCSIRNKFPWVKKVIRIAMIQVIQVPATTVLTVGTLQFFSQKTPDRKKFFHIFQRV